MRKFGLGIFIILSILSGCKDKEVNPGGSGNGNNNSNNNTSYNSVEDIPLSSAGSLNEGSGEFGAVGGESFVFNNGATSWRKWGSVTHSNTNNRTYAVTQLKLYNNDSTHYMVLQFHVHDPDAGMFGGKLPGPGEYSVNLTEAEKEADTTEQYARVVLYPPDDYYSNNSDCEGSVTVTDTTGGVIQGLLKVYDMENDPFADEEKFLDLRATFNAKND